MTQKFSKFGGPGGAVWLDPAAEIEAFTYDGTLTTIHCASGHAYKVQGSPDDVLDVLSLGGKEPKPADKK